MIDDKRDKVSKADSQGSQFDGMILDDDDLESLFGNASSEPIKQLEGVNFSELKSSKESIEVAKSNSEYIVRDEEKPNNAKPTHTAKFHWLGGGMLAALATNLTLTTTATVISTTSLINSSSNWAIGVSLGSLAIAALGRVSLRSLPIFNKVIKKKYEAKRTFNSEEEEKRIRKILDKLDPEGKFDHTTNIATDKIKNLGFIDRLGKKDLLLFNPFFSSKLNDRQLTNLIAHELAHANKLYTGMVDGAHVMTRLACVATFWSTAIVTFQGISTGGFLSGTLGVVGGVALATCYSTLVNVGSGVFSNMSSRANELRTDIRAVEMTQDLGGYISGLQ